MLKYKKFTFYAFLTLFIFFGALTAVFYSSWGQNLARSYVSSSLKKEGLHAEIESFEGILLPSTVKLKNVKFAVSETSSLSIETLKARLSFLYLLKNEIYFSKIAASNVTWISQKETKKTSPFSAPATSPSLPMAFGVGFFEASNVKINDLEPVHLKGRLEIGAGRKQFLLKIEATREKDVLKLRFKRKKNGSFSWKANLHLFDASWLAALYDLPFPDALDLEANASGEPQKPMQGHFTGKASLEKSRFFENPWSFKGQFQRNLEGLVTVSPIFITGNDLQAQASLSLDAAGDLLETSGQLETKTLFTAEIKGSALARWIVRKEADHLTGKIVAQIPELHFKEFSFQNIELVIDSSDWQGSFAASGVDWSGKGLFSAEDTFALRGLEFSGSQMKGFGDLTLLPDGTIQAAGELAIENLQAIKEFAPNWDPYGSITIKLMCDGKHFTFDALAHQLYVKSIYFEQAAFYSDLQDPFGNLQGVVSIDIEKGNFQGLTIDSALFETTIEGNEWPFHLFAEGVLKRDFEVYSEGVWQLKNHDFSAQIYDFHGLFYSHPFALKNPARITLNPLKTEISRVDIDLADASAAFALIREENSGSLHLELSQFPLDVLSINPLEVAVNGLLDFKGDFTETQKKLAGQFEASIYQVEVSRIGETEAITAEGALKGQLVKDQLRLQGLMSARRKPLAALDVELPVHIQADPFTFDFLYDRPSKGIVDFHGRLEDFLDFFNLRSHWMEGNCMAHLSWVNTLAEPKVEGSVHITDGYYENYYTGTQLTQLEMELGAQKGKLQLKSLRARDGFGVGSMSGDGAIELRLSEKFPFHIHLGFQNFHFMQLGFVSVKANSALDILGNLEGSLAKGEIHVIESAVTIPEKIPRKPPNLHAVYLNAQKPVQKPESKSFKPYPLHLDIELNTPNGISISGRGLTSDWRGAISLKGTSFAPQPIGKLELEKGEFAFAGRIFKLTRGSLSFGSENSLIPLLDLSGTTEQQGISIIANLEGPLNRPQLTFHSTPPLSLSTIIAHLLFGQDISEINGLQALQLAATVSTIAGQSPDVLESTRRSLGIDRLRIVSDPTSEGGESISIQVGKYVAPGVLVSISQNANNTAPNISIEVDIGAGFFFQAETDQLQEQGKFGIKWNRNY